MDVSIYQRKNINGRGIEGQIQSIRIPHQWGAFISTLLLVCGVESSYNSQASIVTGELRLI